MPQARISTLSTRASVAAAFGPKSSGPIPATLSSVSDDGARLLEDLLLHEVPVGAELDGGARGLDRDHRPLDPRALRVVDRVRLAPDVGDVALVEIRDAARHRQQRRGVGGDVVVVLAEADDHRAALARADDAAGLARRDHGDRVRALELGDGQLHRAQQVAVRGAVPVRVHEVGDDLGIGLRRERVALRHQALAQRLEVLDDAVVDDRRPRRSDRCGCALTGDGAPCVAQRVCEMPVPPESCRSSACAARSATRAVLTSRSSRAAPLAGGDDRQPGRVVAPVLEPADAVDQDRDDVARGGRADDAAHGG